MELRHLKYFVKIAETLNFSEAAKLFTASDSALWLFREGYDAEALGKLIKYKSIIYCFADPIIMLFLGGFILAIAATKTGMDCALAKVMLKPFGTQSKYVLLGFVLLTYKDAPLGFVKNIGNRANNLYPQEWRIRSGYLPEEVICALNGAKN